MQIINNFVKLNNINSLQHTTPIKNTVSFGQNKNDSVELSEQAKLAQKLRKNCPAVKIKATINGEENDWIMYKNSQMGSQDAVWAESNTGELYYIKYAKNKEKLGHIKSEVIASKLYNLAGIQTPEIKPIIINRRIKGLASKFEAGMQQALYCRTLHDAFAVDAWLANWDAVVHGNTFEKNGKSIKVDCGGALNYRAQGAMKTNFDDTVDEIITLIDGRNYDSKVIYSHISHKDLVDSFKRVCNIPDESITSVVKDENLALTLINRKKYMAKFLEKIEKIPYKQIKLDIYLKTIKAIIEKEESTFGTDYLRKHLSSYLVENTKQNYNTIDIPNTKLITKKLVEILEKFEKQGPKITQNELIQVFKELSVDGLDLRNIKPGYETRIHQEQFKSMFNRLFLIATKTPKEENESIATYAEKIINLREKRNNQLEALRNKDIKSQLKYEPEKQKPSPRPLTNTERKKAIAELNEHYKLNNEQGNKLKHLSKNATDEEIFKEWQRAHLGAFQFFDEDIQKAVMQLGGRYNSTQPTKTKTMFELIADKDYKNEFKYEPVYHWFQQKNPEKFIAELPKNGEIYSLPMLHCCSSHKHYAEMDYGDHLSSLNIKFIMHPKSKTSRAYNLGFNQEVIYPAGENFKILNKELVEYIDPQTGAGHYRWEIHMQEI